MPHLCGVRTNAEGGRTLVLDGDVLGMAGTARELDHADRGGREIHDGLLRLPRPAEIPRVIEGSGFTIEADLAIKALGFDPEDVGAMSGSKDLALELEEKGYVGVAG